MSVPPVLGTSPPVLTSPGGLKELGTEPHVSGLGGSGCVGSSKKRSVEEVGAATVTPPKGGQPLDSARKRPVCNHKLVGMEIEEDKRNAGNGNYLDGQHCKGPGCNRLFVNRAVENEEEEFMPSTKTPVRVCPLMCAKKEDGWDTCDGFAFCSDCVKKLIMRESVYECNERPSRRKRG